MNLARGACLLVLGAVVAGACTPLLSLDVEFKGVAETLCKCDAFTDPESPFWPEAEGSEGCIAYLQARLGEEGAEEWLDAFQELGCDSCENASLCVSLPPVCIPTGEPCVGTSLASDASCCGYDPENVTESYCGPSNVCSKNAPGCKAPLEECEEDIDCCGGDGGLAFCIPETEDPESRTVCLNVCELDDPVQCPGCCARIQPKSEEPEYGVCFNFDMPLKACEELCVNLGDCGFNSLCAPEEQQDFYIYVCVPLTE
ncbi:MAG: hypothetical protein JNK04_21315, partial [Myxococcales bacterium]|nr:hypothetical protein [Myxococcales bacterium]